MNGFTEAEQNFALNVLKQIPERRLNENSYVCEYGYVHGDFNDETKEAFEEADEIIRKIKEGEHIPRYNNFSEILADIDAELEDEKNEKAAI